MSLSLLPEARGQGADIGPDERNMPAINRAGEPEDIVASLLCRDGKLLEGEYEAGDAYR